jgi:Flp pilus assembly protein protease CpaA
VKKKKKKLKKTKKLGSFFPLFLFVNMGATDSKLAFRKGVFRLFEERVKNISFISLVVLMKIENRTYLNQQMTIGLW